MKITDHQEMLEVIAATFGIAAPSSGEPVPQLITDACVPQPRWEAFFTAMEQGLPWSWVEDENRHCSICRFCARRRALAERDRPARFDTKTVATTSSGTDETPFPKGLAPQAPDTVGTTFPHREDPQAAVIRRYSEKLLVPILSQSPPLTAAALKSKIEEALAAQGLGAALPPEQRKVVWKGVADAAQGCNRSTRIVLLGEGGGLTNQEIAAHLNIPEEVVFAARVFVAKEVL